MDLEGIVLSEVSQRKTCYLILLLNVQFKTTTKISLQPQRIDRWLPDAGGWMWAKWVKGVTKYKLPDIKQISHEDAMYSIRTMVTNTVSHFLKLLIRKQMLKVLITRKRNFKTMMTNVNQIYCGDHFSINTMLNHQVAPKTNIMFMSSVPQLKKKTDLSYFECGLLFLETKCSLINKYNIQQT